ncbi:hypothetical protein HNR77_006001 [Paenibacillus sp. JGP012]|uniref:DUF6870 family protein n=1 Tax=Paenibacillus sp. JGP012 TaxID=2735914 RepID=UPI0017AE81BB|nr:hypothetical protein [Paenibacillus sp. JGP012]MBB6024855.1 hypothetical protein [Paenibacillus sp. JGP012]
MITSALNAGYKTVKMETVDKEKLTDISTIKFDKSLPMEKRSVYIIKKLKNPFCFRCGDVVILLEFDDTAPPIQEVLTNFMIRKKSGL